MVRTALPPDRHGRSFPAPRELTGDHRPLRRLGVPKSERTPSPEDPVSGRLRTEAQAEAAQPTPRTPPRKVAMSAPESRFTHFAGFDWAKQHHHVVILNPAGQIVAEFGFAHTEAGWQQWREQAARFAPLAVAVETSQGIVIDQLLQTPDCTIYPLNPKAARAVSRPQSPRAAPRAIIWMPGALPTPYGWMVRTGNRSPRRTPFWNSCACCAATSWP
jgi:hypothetical protein